MPVEAELLEALELRLDGARLWGLEVDLRYRVAAATFETGPERHPLGPRPGDPPSPAGEGGEEDSRLQLLLFPVGHVAGALHDRADEPPRRFPIEQLLEVVSSFEGATAAAPFFDAPEPHLGVRPSFAGASSAQDGRAHRFTIALGDSQRRLLVVTMTFDDVRLRTPAGHDVPRELW